MGEPVPGPVTLRSITLMHGSHMLRWPSWLISHEMLLSIPIGDIDCSCWYNSFFHTHFNPMLYFFHWLDCYMDMWEMEGGEGGRTKSRDNG